jgi:hypothetical protein
MPNTNILDSTSYSALDGAAQQTVRQLFEQSYQAGNPIAFNDFRAIFSQRKSLAASIHDCAHRLEQTNPAMLVYLNDSQKKWLEHELLFAFYVYSAQYYLDLREDRGQHLEDLGAQIKKCAGLIDHLGQTMRPKSPDADMVQRVADSDKPAKYLGLTFIAPAIAGTMVDLSTGEPDLAKANVSSGQTVKARGWMTDVNGVRLYWVWGGGLLSNVISLFPDYCLNKQQACSVVASPSTLTGYMSWILYYSRFGINLSLLLKHTISGPWMHQQEREQISCWERFKTQWDCRKFALLNDSIWGMANMACFLWLVGPGTLGYLGNVVTTALLLMDVCITAWRFAEESTEHHATMARYDRDIQALECRPSSDIRVLDIYALKKARARAEANWQYKKYSTVNDLIYSVALLASFFVMCACLIPPAAMAATTAMSLGLLGASLCFVLTVAYAAVGGRIEILKTYDSAKDKLDQCLWRVSQFNGSEDGRVKQQLYLSIKQLLGQSQHQQQLMNSQQMKWVLDILIQSLVPPVIFVSLIALPLSMGLGVIAAGFALALLSTKVLTWFGPKAYELPTMNEQEYQDLLHRDQDLRLTDFPQATKMLSFFNKKVTPHPLQPEYYPDHVDALMV